MKHKNAVQLPVKVISKLNTNLKYLDNILDEQDSTLRSPQSHTSRTSDQLRSPSTKSTVSPQKTSPSFKDILNDNYICLTEDKRYLSCENSFISNDHNASAPYLKEINICKDQINTLKKKIDKIQKNSVKPSTKNKYHICHFPSGNQLEDQKNTLKKQYRLALARMKGEIFQEFRKEFENLHKKTVVSLKNKQRVKLKKEVKEIEDQFGNELTAVEAEFEEKLARKIRAEKESYERLVISLKKENAVLRHENKILKEKTDSLQEKITFFEELSDDSKPCRKRYCQEVLKDLGESYKKLQEEHRILSLSKEKKLCGNCQAFIKAGDNLAGQIGRLKEYLGLNSS